MRDLQAALDNALAPTPREREPVAHGIYLAPVGEHAHRAEILRRLPELTAGKRGKARLHIGVGGLFNFEMASITRPDAILLADANPVQKQLWDYCIEVMRRTEDPASFRRQLIDVVRTSPAPQHEIDYDVEYLRGHSLPWLAPDTYRHLRQLACDGKILTAEIDLVTDRDRSEALGKFLHEKGFQTQTCYWSNITDFIGAADKKGRPLHTDGAVFEKGVKFAHARYCVAVKGRHAYAGKKAWDGQEQQSQLFAAPKAMAFADYPPLEQFLRNVSAIGGRKGLHFMTGNEDMEPAHPAPLMMFDGPPRRVQERA